MIYRRFGRTGLRMPVFSCGGMRFQQAWKDMPLAEITAESQDRMEQTVRRALELGINHIETARGYGSSERQLGEILPKIERGRLIVQTKVGPSADAGEFVKNVEDSLGRLKLDHVDLLAIHGVNTDELLHQCIRPGGCLAAARAIQKRGLARHIGFSTHGPLPVILRALEHEGDGGFDYMNLHWYFIFQRTWPAIELAAKKDVGVFIISPADKGGMLYNPPAKLMDLCRPVHPIVFNALFCLSQPQVHTLSIGAARASDFEPQLDALEHLVRADAIVRPIMAKLKEAHDAAIPEVLRTPFDGRLPEWDKTPGEVNVPVIVQLHNLMAAWDMREYAKMRYNMLGNGGHWYPGKNAADLDEPAIRGALVGHPDPDAVMETLRATHEALGGESVKRLSQGG